MMRKFLKWQSFYFKVWMWQYLKGRGIWAIYATPTLNHVIYTSHKSSGSLLCIGEQWLVFLKSALLKCLRFNVTSHPLGSSWCCSPLTPCPAPPGILLSRVIICAGGGTLLYIGGGGLLKLWSPYMLLNLTSPLIEDPLFREPPLLTLFNEISSFFDTRLLWVLT